MGGAEQKLMALFSNNHQVLGNSCAHSENPHSSDRCDNLDKSDSFDSQH